MLALATVALLFGNMQAQHCSDITVADNGASAKLRDGAGFSGSYTFPCVAEGTYSEIAVPFKTFLTIAKGNSDDTVYQMRIDQISNLPEGMCWVTNKPNNVFGRNEGGLLVLRGITNDNAGQFNLNITMSFDTKGDGTFARENVNYNKISKTGKMIVRVIAPGATCEPIDYEVVSNTSGIPSGNPTASKQ